MHSTHSTSHFGPHQLLQVSCGWAMLRHHVLLLLLRPRKDSWHLWGSWRRLQRGELSLEGGVEGLAVGSNLQEAAPEGYGGHLQPQVQHHSTAVTCFPV